MGGGMGGGMRGGYDAATAAAIAAAEGGEDANVISQGPLLVLTTSKKIFKKWKERYYRLEPQRLLIWKDSAMKAYSHPYFIVKLTGQERISEIKSQQEKKSATTRPVFVCQVHFTHNSLAKLPH